MRSSFMFLAAISASAALFLGGLQSGANAGPTTQPAPVAYAPATASVMIFPFRQIGNSADGEWISQAIDEDLRSDLMRNPSISLVFAPEKLPASPAEALQAGRSAGATYVLYGSYQFVNGQVRVTASLINVAAGTVVAPLKATGNALDVFQLEDELSAQLQSLLPAPPSVAGPANPDQGAPTTYNFFYSAPSPPPDDESPAPGVAYYPAIPYGYDNGLLYGGIGVFGGGGFYGGRGYHYGRFGNRGGFFGSPGRGFSMSRGGGFGGGFHGGGGFGGGGRR
jgi:TolB-like protein